MSLSGYRKKLIEVDLPLADINRESAGQRHLNLHKWWARRPLAACRAVIFASLVDDPSSCPDEYPDEESQHIERERLHNMIRSLLKSKNIEGNNPGAHELIANARYEIARSVARSRGDTPPQESDPIAVLDYLSDRALPIYDPFAGGASIPLEAQRLGLSARASDLNPVAVLINKALIEIPPKFSAKPPVNPDADPMGMLTGKHVGRGKNRKPEQVLWRGAAGLADDIRYFGKWMRDEAFKRIGHLYPKAKLPDGAEATVIAWLWARTIPCPNPACSVNMPLIKSFQISNKSNNLHWTRPIVDRDTNTISFVVQNHGGGVPNVETVNRNGATCVTCNAVAPLKYVREQARAGNLGETMTAIVTEGEHKQQFISVTAQHRRAVKLADPQSRPNGSLPEKALGFRIQAYGFTEWRQLFTDRQLLALTTFSELVRDVHDSIVNGGSPTDYADAVCTYLALAVSRSAQVSSSFARWRSGTEKAVEVFARPNT